jgi:hypothetical protein
METNPSTEETMGAKPQPTPPKGVKLEDRYGQVGLKAVAGAIRSPKPGKTG